MGVKMRKRLLSICLIVMLLVCLSTTLFACADKVDYEKNLLQNSDFELKSESTSAITGWVASNTATVTFPSNDRDDDYDVRLGKHYVRFNETSGAYVYIAQNVTLEKNAKYRISAYVNVSNIVESSGIGFRFGFDTPAGFNGLNLVDKTEGYENVEFYFTSSTDKEVKFVVGIGSPSVQTSGDVCVDNIKLEKVEQIPASYLEDHKDIEVLKYNEKYSLASAGSIVFTVLMTIVSVLLFVGLFILIKVASKPGIEKNLDENPTTWTKVKKALSSNFALFIYVIAGSFIVRFLISVLSFGMTSNIEALENMSAFSAKFGILSVYSNDAKLTMPMGGVLIYSLLGYLAEAMNIKIFSLGYAILMRMPLIIADVITVYIIYTFAAKHKDEKQAAVYSAIYAFVPLFFFTGSFAAQLECISIAFIIACMICILNKDYITGNVLFMFAIMFSHYALVILPIVLIFDVYGIIYDEEKRWTIAITMLVSFVIFFLVAMLLSFDSFKDGEVFEYFKRIYQYFKDSAYLTKDAFNIYAVFGANATKTRSTMVEVMNWLFVVAMSAVPGYIYFKNKNRADLVLFAGVMMVLFATFGACANVAILPLGIAIIVLYLVIVPDNRLFAALASLASLAFLNIAMIASQSGYIDQIDGAAYKALASNNAALIIFSILTVASVIYLVYVSMDMAYSNQVSEIKPFEKDVKTEIKESISNLTQKNKTK